MKCFFTVCECFQRTQPSNNDTVFRIRIRNILITHCFQCFQIFREYVLKRF